MAAGSDVRDILEVAGSGEKEFMTKDALMYSDKKVWLKHKVFVQIVHVDPGWTRSALFASFIRL